MAAPDEVPAVLPFPAELPFSEDDHRARWPVRVVSAVGAVACITPLVSPALALAGGATIGLTVGDPMDGKSRSASSLLLKAAVVGLGFGLSLPAVIATGRSGFTVMAGGIAVALVIGMLLGRWMRVDHETSTLISGGTAICGGSAIAAMAPALGANGTSISVATATVFLLNGVALYVFPAIGHLVGLSQDQFGMWAAIAIHDTSSVVGAAAQFGERALELATVLKLTRALWIIPLIAGIALWRQRSSLVETQASSPLFIVLFLIASGLRALLPDAAAAFDVLEAGARRLLVLALFLVGLGLTRATLRDVGVRPLLQGTALWVVMAGGSLVVVQMFPHIVG